jgi:hypothetical protein
MTQEDERTERGKTCTGASTAARQAREDTASLTLGVARNECGRGTTARIHGRSQSSEDVLTHDPSRVCGNVGIRRTYLRRARGEESELRRRPNGDARCRAAQQRTPRPRTRVPAPPQRRRRSSAAATSQHPWPKQRPAADDPAGDHEHAVAGVVQRFRVLWRWRHVRPHDLGNEEVVSRELRNAAQAGVNERPLGQELPLRFANDFGEQDVSLGAKSCCSRPMRIRRSPSNRGFRVSDQRPPARLAVNWNCAKPACSPSARFGATSSPALSCLCLRGAAMRQTSWPWAGTPSWSSPRRSSAASFPAAITAFVLSERAANASSICRGRR